MGRLVEHYRRPLYAFLYKMLEGRAADADEVFQEVWFRVIKNVERYEDQSFLSWLFRIAHNLIIDRARRTKMTVDLRDGHEDGLPLEERLPSPKLGPESEAAGRDLGTRIRAAVARLPDEQREVFLMRTEADIPFKEIAKMQKTSINTALARMHYAVLKLREELRGDYESLARG
jgi:RNA polymerase sigma-70 factor, ECF subfamily